MQYGLHDGNRLHFCWQVALRAQQIACDGEVAILILASERRDPAAIRFAAETVLSHDLAGETALAAISSRLVQAINDDLDAPIRVSLAQLCQTLSSDCGDLLLLNAADSAWNLLAPLVGDASASLPQCRRAGSDRAVGLGMA